MHGRKLPSQYDRCKPDPGSRRRIQESFWAGDTLEWETTLTDPTVFVKPFVEGRTLKSRSNYDFTEQDCARVEILFFIWPRQFFIYS